MRPKPIDGGDDLGHACSGCRFGLEDRGTPVVRLERLQREHRDDRLREAIGAIAIRLVDDEDVRDFHDARFERLHFVAGPGHEHDDRHVGRADDVHLVLANADGLDDHDVLPRGIENERHVARRARKPAEMAARRHASNEHPLVAEVGGHPHAISENGAA